MPSRDLSPLEMPYVVTNTTSSGSFVVRGELDTARLNTAYAALQREYPVLAGHMEPSDTAVTVIVDDHRRDPLTVSVFAQPFAPGDLRLGLRPEVAISGVRVDSDGDRHRVSLGVNHAIADGAHALFLNLRLWELYSDPAAGQSTVTAVPAAPVDLAASSAPALVERAAAAPAHASTHATCAAVVPTPESLEQGDFAFERITLDQETTGALRARAKASGLSLHGLLAGVIVLAERQEIDGAPDDLIPMAVFSPVDLRGRVQPPVPAAAVTNFAGSSVAPLLVSERTSAESIGRSVLERLTADLADGTVAAALTGVPGVRVTGGAPIRLSNIGPIPAPTLPPELTALDFYTSSEVDIERIRLLARTAPAAALEALVGLHYHALTFAGQLSVEIRHAPGTLPAETTRRIRERIREGLCVGIGASA